LQHAGYGGEPHESGEASGSAILWSYDDNAPLLGESRFDSSGSETAQASDTVDAVGNRLSQSSGGQTTTYSYNTLDRLTSTNTNYTHDAATTL
jgi:YD repeat-containing protein